MSDETPDYFEVTLPESDNAQTPDQEILSAAIAGPKEAPRKRYAAPSAPRVLRCMLPSVKG